MGAFSSEETDFAVSAFSFDFVLESDACDITRLGLDLNLRDNRKIKRPSIKSIKIIIPIINGNEEEFIDDDVSVVLTLFDVDDVSETPLLLPPLRGSLVSVDVVFAEVPEELVPDAVLLEPVIVPELDEVPDAAVVPVDAVVVPELDEVPELVVAEVPEPDATEAPVVDVPELDVAEVPELPELVEVPDVDVVPVDAVVVPEPVLVVAAVPDVDVPEPDAAVVLVVDVPELDEVPDVAAVPIVEVPEPAAVAVPDVDPVGAAAVLGLEVLGGRPELGRLLRGCPGFTCTISTVVFLDARRVLEAAAKLLESELQVTKTIFLGRLGREVTYSSV